MGKKAKKKVVLPVSTPKKMPNLVRPSDYMEREFRPYTKALGAAALAWNELHESLAVLFWTLTGDEEGKLSLAVWNVIRNDNYKRDMLEASIWTAGLAESHADDIKWALGEITKFSHERNKVVHAPLCRLYQKRGVFPSTARNNILARKLSINTKDGVTIADQYDWVRRWCLTMGRFVLSLAEADAPASQTPWPSRPELPQAPDLPRP